MGYVFLLPCLSSIQRLRESAVLFASLAVRSGHETEFSPVRCVWGSTGNLGKVFLSASEKGTQTHSMPVSASAPDFECSVQGSDAGRPVVIL